MQVLVGFAGFETHSHLAAGRSYPAPATRNPANPAVPQKIFP
jgi:hypothetical protein